jgi:hypothetical protein
MMAGDKSVESLPQSKSAWKNPWTITGVAFILRLAALALRYGRPGSVSLRAFPFPSELSWIARSIAMGWGFSSPMEIPSGPTASATPVYPYLLAGIFRLFGVRTFESAVVALVLNCIFSSLTCWVVYRLAKDTFDENTGVTAAWIWALLPLSVYFAVARIWETSLSALLGTLLVLVGIEIERNSTMTRWAEFGVVAALAALTNPSLIGVLPFLGIWIVLRLSKRGEQWFAGAALSAVICIAAITPWMVRNYEVFGRVIPLRSNLGMQLRIGNGPETEVRERYWLHYTNNLEEREKLIRLGEAAYMDECKREAMEFIRTHPGTFAKQTARKILYIWTGIWSLSPSYLRQNPQDLYDIPPFTLMTVLTIAGLWRAFQNGNSAGWVYAAALFFAPLSYYISHVQARYRHPMDPFFVILAAYAVIEHLRHRREIHEPANA